MYFATTVPHYRRVIDVRFYVSVVEDFFGVDVDMLQLRYVAVKKGETFVVCFCFERERERAVSYTHLTLPTRFAV